MFIAKMDTIQNVINEERSKNGGMPVILNFSEETSNADAYFEEEELAKGFDNYEEIRGYYPRFADDYRKAHNIPQEVSDSKIMEKYYVRFGTTYNGEYTSALSGDAIEWWKNRNKKCEEMLINATPITEAKDIEKIYFVIHEEKHPSYSSKIKINYIHFLLTDPKLAKYLARELNEHNKGCFGWDGAKVVSAKSLMQCEMTNGARKTNG